MPNQQTSRRKLIDELAIRLSELSARGHSSLNVADIIMAIATDHDFRVLFNAQVQACRNNYDLWRKAVLGPPVMKSREETIKIT